MARTKTKKNKWKNNKRTINKKKNEFTYIVSIQLFEFNQNYFSCFFAFRHFERNKLTKKKKSETAIKKKRCERKSNEIIIYSHCQFNILWIESVPCYQNIFGYTFCLSLSPQIFLNYSYAADNFSFLFFFFLFFYFFGVFSHQRLFSQFKPKKKKNRVSLQKSLNQTVRCHQWWEAW